MIRRHLMGPMRGGRCNSNNCMKLSFERGECQCAERQCDDWRVASQAGRSSSPPRTAAVRLVLRERDVGEPEPATIFDQKREERLMGFNVHARQREWLNRMQSF